MWVSLLIEGANILVDSRQPAHERAFLPQSSPRMGFDIDRSSSPLPEFPMGDLPTSDSPTLAPSQEGRSIPP